MKGVENYGDNSIIIRLVLMTSVGQQWDVGREYRRRLKPAFDAAGIIIPFPQRSIWFENALPTGSAQTGYWLIQASAMRIICTHPDLPSSGGMPERS
jgi:small-conductance mechanosensitive channel